MNALADERRLFGFELADELELVIQSLIESPKTERLMRMVREYIDIAHSFLLDFHGLAVWDLDDGASVARITCCEHDVRALADHVRAWSLS